MLAAEHGLKGDPRLQAISQAIRVIPHFPKPVFKNTIDIFVDRYKYMGISVVAGFLSLSRGGTTNYIDSSNISWALDVDYVVGGNSKNVVFLERTSSSSLPIPDFETRKCYRLPLII